jgi:hypothetical protein
MADPWGYVRYLCFELQDNRYENKPFYHEYELSNSSEDFVSSNVVTQQCMPMNNPYGHTPCLLIVILSHHMLLMFID